MTSFVKKTLYFPPQCFVSVFLPFHSYVYDEKDLFFFFFFQSAISRLPSFFYGLLLSSLAKVNALFLLDFGSLIFNNFVVFRGTTLSQGNHWDFLFTFFFFNPP